MKKRSKIFSLLIMPVLLLSFTFPSVVFGLGNNDSADRISGADRYETALNIAKTGWRDGAENIVLAPGVDANLVDALTSAPLASAKNAPILLSQKNGLSTATKAYLTLKTKTAYVVSKAFSSNVIAELEAMDIEVIQLGGKDRFATAANIAHEIKDVSGVFVTTAKSNADALSIAAVAAVKGMPILLAQKDNIPSEEAAYLDEVKDDLAQSYIIGGTAVLSDDVKDAVPGEVTRISGANRYATNLEVLKVFFAGEEGYNQVFVANGTDKHLVDALSVSALAASTNTPIVLVDKEFNQESKDQVAGILSANGKVVALGGESVVSSSVIATNYVKAEDFGVMQVSEVNGYTVGFNLPRQDLVSLVEVSLYKDNTLLAKNVSTNKLFSLSGPQFSSPFNINGNYAGDAYWRSGKWAGTIYDVPTKAEIKVQTLDGKTYTVINSGLTGDPESLLTEDEKHVKAEDFGVMQISGVNGYNVGFSLIDGKDASDLSAVEVSLYDAQNKLLAQNTATYKLFRLTATQLSSPFNIDGSFQADGYWNYGAWNGTITDVPAKAVIKVTYESTGSIYTVTNNHLTGDPGKLGPAEVTTDLAAEAMVNQDLGFGLETAANGNAGEMVRVKATLIDGAAGDFTLKYQDGGTVLPLTFTDGVAWYGPESGFPLADLTSNFKINIKEAGKYSFKFEVVRLSDNKVLAGTTNSVEASLTAPTIESNLPSSIVAGTETAFSVATAPNSDPGSTVRVRITLTGGDAANIALFYQQGDEFIPLTFDDNGITWYGPESGFPLADLASNFKVTFSQPGDYSYKLEIVKGDTVIGSSSYDVNVTEAPTT